MAPPGALLPGLRDWHWQYKRDLVSSGRNGAQLTPNFFSLTPRDHLCPQQSPTPPSARPSPGSEAASAAEGSPVMARRISVAAASLISSEACSLYQAVWGVQMRFGASFRGP